jgi:hypothetical protein
MTIRLPFTQLAIRRAIRAARAEGCGVVEIKPDGSILVKLGDDDAPRLAPAGASTSKWADAKP